MIFGRSVSEFSAELCAWLPREPLCSLLAAVDSGVSCVGSSVKIVKISPENDSDADFLCRCAVILMRDVHFALFRLISFGTDGWNNGTWS